MGVYAIFFIPLIFFVSCNSQSGSDNFENSSQTEAVQKNATIPKFRLVKIADSLLSPVGIVNAGDGSGRLFILEQPGIIRVIQNGKLLKKPFLDISQKVVKLSNDYSEEGLLGLAFHPDFKINKRFFVYYSSPSSNKDIDHLSVLSEYDFSKEENNFIPQEKSVLLTIKQPESNHNGGNLAFGPDGFLYIGLGDGGGAGDKHGKIGNAQDLSSLLGKILRIDVDKEKPYVIPKDNPFTESGQRKEIYAYGFRNPWRFSFDPVTGKLFAGDVGQDKFEEVDIIEKGKNYGWRYKEGFHTYDATLENEVGEVAEPIYTYNHSYGQSVIGGLVYRGEKMKNYTGDYFFGDWNGKMLYLKKNGDVWMSKYMQFIDDPKIYINSFGVGEDGEIYVAGQKEIGAKSNTGCIYLLLEAE